MIDSIRLTKRVSMHAPDLMRALRFSPTCGHADRKVTRPATWSLNPTAGGEARLRLTWKAAPDGFDYLSAEVSLPKLISGSNVYMLGTDFEMANALSRFSCLVSDCAHVHFNALTSNVNRVDYCYNWKLKEPADVYAYLNAFMGASLARNTRRVIGETTVEFSNRSHCVILYSKFDEMYKSLRDGKASSEALQAAVGVLRLEKRYLHAPACRRLARYLNLPNRWAPGLLNIEVATLVLERTMKQLGLNESVASGDCREARLREFYGPGQRYLRLLGFLAACDALGAENLITLGVCGRSDYYRKIQEVKEAGAWLVLPVKRTLPPLRLVQHSNNKESPATRHLRAV